MKYIFIILFFLGGSKAYSQDTTFTRTYPCNCDSSIKFKTASYKALQNYMKKKGITCTFPENGIETSQYVVIKERNTTYALVQKYKPIRLRVKLSVLCNSNGLKIKMQFQESKIGTELWIGTLTTNGKEFAEEVYEDWKNNIYSKFCTK